MDRKTVTLVVGALLLAAVLGGGYAILVGGEKKPETPQPPEQTPTPKVEKLVPQQEETLSNRIVVSNQQAGNTVTVDLAELASPGYVVIHEDNNGSPGPVIGASSLIEGRRANFQINLKRNSKNGENLYAMLHKDDGDSTYEFPGDDTPVKDESGKVVVSKFSIVEKSAQVREINAVSGNFFFNPNNITLKKNQPVRISFKNSGFHTFTIDELGVNVPLQGSSATVEFTPTKAGTFEYYCAVPGHRERGMLGSLNVE